VTTASTADSDGITPEDRAPLETKEYVDPRIAEAFEKLTHSLVSWGLDESRLFQLTRDLRNEYLAVQGQPADRAIDEMVKLVQHAKTLHDKGELYPFTYDDVRRALDSVQKQLARDHELIAPGPARGLHRQLAALLVHVDQGMKPADELLDAVAQLSTEITKSTRSIQTLYDIQDDLRNQDADVHAANFLRKYHKRRDHKDQVDYAQAEVAYAQAEQARTAALAELMTNINACLTIGRELGVTAITLDPVKGTVDMSYKAQTSVQ